MLSVTTNAQKIRRKHFGSYSGVIASFELVIDTVAIPVLSVPINVRFEKDSSIFMQTIGESQLKGTWSIRKKTSTVIYLTVSFPNLAIEEQYELYLDDRKLLRNGMYPQPNTELSKD